MPTGAFVARRNGKVFVTGNSGFPKSLDVSKAIDKAAGAEREVVGKSARHVSGKPEQRTDGLCGSSTFSETIGMGANLTAPATDAAKQWQGWGTALKPAWEPIFLARKPLDGTVAENVQKYGTGALNIDACRVEYTGQTDPRTFGGKWRTDKAAHNVYEGGYEGLDQTVSAKGRWPANLAHDGSEEVMELFPVTCGGHWSYKQAPDGGLYKHGLKDMADAGSDKEKGSAARFFYCAKASKVDRDEGCEGLEEKRSDYRPNETEDGYGGNALSARLHNSIPSRNFHPTVKPTALMRYLVKLVSRPGHTILDPFSGSGSTGKAAILEARQFLGIELQPEYVQIATARLSHAVKLHQESSAQQNLL